MIKNIKLVSLGILASAFCAVALIGTIHAQSAPMTDAQIARIRLNCVSAKNTIAQLHASDALLRVNRGQIYESMTTKLMARFNDRASSNHYDISGLTLAIQNYNAMLTSFRTDYQVYEEQLSSVLNIDCTKEPVAFYDAVSLARTQRSQVHIDITRLNQYIDDYDTVLNVFINSEVTGK